MNWHWDFNQSEHTSPIVCLCMCVLVYLCRPSRSHVPHCRLIGQEWLSFPVQLLSHFLSSSLCHPGQIYTAASPFSFMAHFLQRQFSHADNETYFPTSLSVFVLCYKWLVYFMLKDQVVALKLQIICICCTVSDFWLFGGRTIKIFYSSKNSNNSVKIVLQVKVLQSKSYFSKSTKVLASEYT